MSLPIDNYIVSRSATEAERLELQHRCIISCQGYYLHPEVSLLSSHARVGELCTGTAIWLRELAAANPKQECHGFDISNTMFPAQASLSENVQLHIADIKQPFEHGLLESFDVVHIRLIQAAMKMEEWGPVLQNIVTLLKPGGWLQWFEDDRAVAVRHSCRPVAPLGLSDIAVLGNKTGNQWSPPRLSNLSSLNATIMPDERALAMNYGYMNLNNLMADPDVGNLCNVAVDSFVIDRQDDDGNLRRGLG